MLHSARSRPAKVSSLCGSWRSSPCAYPLIALARPAYCFGAARSPPRPISFKGRWHLGANTGRGCSRLVDDGQSSNWSCSTPASATLEPDAAAGARLSPSRRLRRPRSCYASRRSGRSSRRVGGAISFLNDPVATYFPRTSPGSWSAITVKASGQTITLGTWTPSAHGTGGHTKACTNWTLARPLGSANARARPRSSVVLTDPSCSGDPRRKSAGPRPIPAQITPTIVEAAEASPTPEVSFAAYKGPSRWSVLPSAPRSIGLGGQEAQCAGAASSYPSWSPTPPGASSSTSATGSWPIVRAALKRQNPVSMPASKFYMTPPILAGGVPEAISLGCDETGLLKATLPVIGLQRPNGPCPTCCKPRAS